MFSKDIYRDYKTFFTVNFNNISDKTLLPRVLKVMTISLLAVAVVSSLITYLFVLSKENSLQALHSETYTMHMDNIDIRNDVEFTRSIYNVYDKARSISYLHKPDKILEVSCKSDDVIVDVEEYQTLNQNRIVAGF